MKAMGTPDLNSELRQTVVSGVLEEAGERSIEQLAAKENEVLVGTPCTARKGRNLTFPQVHSDKETLNMTLNTSSASARPAHRKTTSGCIYFLDAGGGRVLSANPDGSDLQTIVSEGRKFPDGLTVDAAAGHLYWTNMNDRKANDGSILRSDLDGRNITTIVPPGGTFTPKQLQLDTQNRKLYWSDREGMRVMRANLDGSRIETLVDTSSRGPASGAGPKEVVRGHRGRCSRWKDLLEPERR